MNNSVYNYNSIVSKDFYQVKDYTSFYYGGLEELFNQYPQFFEYITVDDDYKLEGISWRRYGNENFADVILACNKEVFLWCMPYSNDVLIEIKGSLEHIFQNELGISTGDERFNDFIDFIDLIDEDVEERNTRKRLFRVPIKEKLSDVINLINTYKSQNQVNQFDDFVES